jgi:hypothetical protein
MEQIVYEAR